MGQPPQARVDVAGLHVIATHYDAAAETVAAARRQLSGLMFDGTYAGRSHAVAGDALRRALDDVADRLGQWSRAAAQIAGALRATADRYTDADARAARRLE